MMPELPTVSETLPGFEMLSWFGLLAPAGTPPAIISRVNVETAKALALPDVKAGLTAQGFEVMAGTPERVGNYIKNEISKITKIAKIAGVTAQ